MDSHRWQRLQSIFDDAIELPAHERAQFVHAQTADDTELAREALGLLAAYEDEPEYLESVLTDRGEAPGAGLGQGDATDPLPGQRVGAWQIGARLGEGGMGVVYRGERADGTFEQSVAIKVVRRGLDTEHLLRRFASERRILAALDHPDIARPVDAGVLPDGRPYLAMEFVEGERIDLYCARHHASSRQRIDLFLDVCDAVDHAHRRLVIHRDLKPANILVTSEGRVKLLDFGVAKLLDPDDPLAASTLTTADLRPLTPDYASPEQLRGEPVTTSADVYALGVLLFELLTGRRPFDRVSRPRSEWIEPREEEAPRPSTVTNVVPAAELAGDLDAVVLTALHPDAERRYESPRALADDLRRHRAGLAVRAREDSTMYRVRRFVGRNRIGVGVAVGFVLFMLVSASLLLRQVERTERERARAEHERAGAERVVQLLVDLFRHSDPTQVPDGDDLPVGTFLERAAQDVDELSDQPAVQIRAWLALAAIHTARNRYDVADSVLARAARRLGDVGPEDAELQTAVESAQGKLWYILGLEDRAREMFRRTVENVRRRHGVDHPDYVIALQDYASTIEDPSERRARLQECVSICERNPDMDPVRLAAALNALALDHFEAEEFDDSAENYERAERVVLAALGPDHPHTMAVRFNLASVRSQKGDHEGAEATFRELLASRERIFGPRSDVVAATHGGLAIALTMQRRHALAEEHFALAATLYTESMGDAHPRVALQWYNLARSRELQEDWDGAVEAYTRAHGIIVRAHGEGSLEEANYLASMIAALLAAGRRDDARAAAERALAIGAEHPDAPTPGLVEIPLAAARVLEATEERAERGALLERSFGRRTAMMPDDDPRLAEAACALAVHLAETAQEERARALLAEHLPRLESWPLAVPGDAQRARAVADRLEREAVQR